MKTESEIKDLIDKAIADGPTFGQSQFQTEAFVVGKHECQGRAYRQVLMELSDKFRALQKAKIKRNRFEAEIALIKEKMDKEPHRLERQILQCDIDEKLVDLEYENKLIKDAISACNHLYSLFEKLPHYNFDQFEAEERLYWQKRIASEAQISVLSNGSIEQGLAQALKQLGFDPIQAQPELKASIIEQAQRLSLEKQGEKP